jgi:hypothetical protein
VLASAVTDHHRGAGTVQTIFGSLSAWLTRGRVGERAAPAPSLSLQPDPFILFTSTGDFLLGERGLPDLPLGLLELRVLAELSAPNGEPMLPRLSHIAREAGANVEQLQRFLEQLDERSLLRHEGVPPDAPPLPETPAASIPDRFVLVTPIALAVRSGGFELADHDDRYAARLSPGELEVARVLTSPTSFAEGLEAQRQRLGIWGLDAAAFERFLRRLLATGYLRPLTSDDPRVARGYDHDAEAARKEIAGKRAVTAAVDRAMDRLASAEDARRAQSGQRRVRVFPVHCIPTSWRNPPLSLGLLFAYVRVHNAGALLSHYDLRPDWLIDLERVDKYLDDPGVFLFSNYIWSTASNLPISARVKEKSPHSVTIHGGPDVPKYAGDVDAYFRANPHVDVAVHGEGELTAAEALAALAGSIGNGPVDLSVLADVPGLSYRSPSGVVRTADRARLTDLDLIPSPYLEGLFDSYVEGWHEIAETHLQAVDGWGFALPVVCMETNRGCPYACTFCDWGSATNSRIRQFSLDRIFAELQWCATNRVDTIGLADANFGIFERDVDITARVAELTKAHGWPRQFGTNYAKNSVKHLRKIVEHLASADILSFGLLSLQSMDENTLATVRRSNIKLERYEDLAREFQRARLPLYVDLMLGLPGQTVAGFRSDLQECANREVHAKIFQTQLLVNSPMNDPAYRAEHGITAKPGELVRESATFSDVEYAYMLKLRDIFLLLEKLSVLRHVARHVRRETGIREVEFFERLWDGADANRSQWPTLAFTLHGLPRFSVPPASWKRLLDEVQRFVVERLGVADDDALRAVIAVQHALLPAPGRRFPYAVELPHDYAAWHAAMLEAKHAGHLDDWPAHVPRLCEFGPGRLVVSDPRGVCHTGMGKHVQTNPWDTWDLDAPVCRAVMQGG